MSPDPGSFGDCQSNKWNINSNNRAVTSKVLLPERANVLQNKPNLKMKAKASQELG